VTVLGAQVAPEAVVEACRRLYEFTVGFVTALITRVYLNSPPRKWVPISEMLCVGNGRERQTKISSE